MFSTTCMYTQDSLAHKVNIDDLASFVPQSGGSGGDETASLMSKLLEIQNRLSQLEGNLQTKYQFY